MPPGQQRDDDAVHECPLTGQHALDLGKERLQSLALDLHLLVELADSIGSHADILAIPRLLTTRPKVTSMTA